MFLNNLQLRNFRSYKKKNFNFDPLLTIITGPNTSGKTNILEAIFLLSLAKSFRAEKDTEMISYQDKYSRIGLEIYTKDEEEKLEIILSRADLLNKKNAFKRYFINGVGKRMIDFVGRMKISLFWPEDLELITDSPKCRRNYLDFVLSQIDREYRRSLRIFEQGIRRRNKLLEKIREGEARKEELTFWNELLIKHGNYLTNKREEYLEFVNKTDALSLEEQFFLEYDKSTISFERLNKYEKEEIAAATTLVGPHRDDFKLKILTRKKNKQQRELALYGSRGEQRLGLLWLKLAELYFLKVKSNGEKPILLLDDILSEFDQKHQNLVLQLIGKQQTIMTTTNLNLIEKKYWQKALIIKL